MDCILRLSRVKLNSVLDNITLVYVNCLIIIDPEHPNRCHEILFFLILKCYKISKKNQLINEIKELKNQ